jgi:hypothetical protein
MKKIFMFLAVMGVMAISAQNAAAQDEAPATFDFVIVPAIALAAAAAGAVVLKKKEN